MLQNDTPHRSLEGLKKLLNLIFLSSFLESLEYGLFYEGRRQQMCATETGVGLDLKIVFSVARHCHLVSLKT